MQGYQVRVYAINVEGEKSQFFPKLNDATKHFNALVANPTWKPVEGDHVVMLKVVEMHRWKEGTID